MIILIDLDGTLANFESRFLEIWREKFPNEKNINRFAKWKITP